MQAARAGAVGLKSHAEEPRLSLSEIRTELELLGDSIRDQLRDLPDLFFAVRIRLGDVRDSIGVPSLLPAPGWVHRHAGLTALALLIGTSILAASLEMLERGGH